MTPVSQKPLWKAQLFSTPTLKYRAQDVLPLRTQKAKLLLFFLLVEWSYYERTEHRREFLADLLWTAHSRKAALENLRQTLYIIRKRLQAFSDQPLFITNRLTVAKVPATEIYSDLQLLKRGHSFDLLQLPCIPHIPLQELVLYESEPFQEWLDQLQAEVPQQSKRVLAQAIEQETTLQKWNVVEQLAQIFLAQHHDAPLPVYKKLAAACIQQGKEVAALNWLKKAGLDKAAQQQWLAPYANLPSTQPTESGKVARLAVLPFPNHGAPANDYFSLGLAEDLTSQLSHYASVEVASSYSVMRYQGVQTPLSEIAFELNVDYLLSGRIYPIGERFRINLQLIEAQRDRILWSASLEHAAQDVFAMQQEVIARVLEGLRHRLGLKEEPQPTYIPKPEAYDRYLQAWSVYLQATPETTQTAIHLYEKAVAADPNFHRAYLGLSSAIASLASWWGDQKIMDVLPRFEVAISKAAEDERLKHDVSCLKGWMAMWMWDLKGAEAYFRKALTAGNSIAFLRLGLAHSLNMQGRHLEAEQVAQEAVVKDPGHIQNYFALAESKLLLGQMEACEQICRSALRAQPDYHSGLSIHIWALRCLQRSDEAIELAEASLRRSGWRTYFIIGRLAQAYLDTGQSSAANRLLHEMMQRAQQGEKGFPYFVALYFQQLGESETAVDWLENYQRDRLSDYLWLKVQPEFKPLHQHERFRRLLQAVFGVDT